MKKQLLKVATILLAAVGFAPQASADTDILKAEDGYTKIAAMPADEDLDDYYFIIVDKDHELMMTLQDNGNKTWYYRTPIDPVTDLNTVWMIEKGTVDNGYSFRSVAEPTYLMETTGGAPWDFFFKTSTSPTNATTFIFNYTNDSWTFENYATEQTKPQYIGPWGGNNFVAGERVAANKGEAERGYFVLYTIERATLDAEVLANAKEAASTKIAENETVRDNANIVPGEGAKAVYEAAINTAKQAVEKATDTDAIDAAMATLEEARKAYLLASTPATGTTLDYTFLIEGACNSTSGWTKTYGPVVSGSQDNYQLQKSTNKNNGALTSDSYIETWTPADKDGAPNKYGAGQLYYTATNLPAGHYRISAYTFDGDKSGVVKFFVNDAEHSMTLDTSTNLFSLSTVDDVAIMPMDETHIGLEITEAGKTQWVGMTNIRLEYISPLTASDLEAAKAQYTEVLAEAETMDITTNVGTAAFQIPTAAVTTVTDGIAAVEDAYDETDIDNVVASTEQLAKLMDDYKNATLNAPADDQVFSIEITTADNWKFKNLPLTLHANGGSFYPERDANCYAQTLMLKQVEGNLYTISTVFADGTEYYLCTASAIGTGNTSQIRTTADQAKALRIEIIPTAEQGVYNLWNTEANGTLGCQDGDDKASGGLYGTPSHSTFAITEVEKPSVTLSTPAGWATLILPFKADIPSGLEVYACSTTETQGDATVLTLEAEDAIEANTPYIVKAAENFTHTFEGFGAAEASTYTSGLLTGTFADMTSIENTYVLQNQDGQVGFYKVTAGAQPTVGANRAYLNAEAAGANVRAILFDTDGDGSGTTGVDAVAADDDAPVNVYNLNGILVRENVKAGEALNGLQKGIYIVNGTKKAVK